MRLFFAPLMAAVFVTVFFLPRAHADKTWIDESQIDYSRLSEGPSNFTEEQFTQLLASISKVYSPIVSSMGGKLNLHGNWKDEKANAGAKQMMGTWEVMVTGGLARRPELTHDALTLITCHELGHHLGGFPISGSAMPNIPGLPIPMPEAWAAVEGQADYFSTHVCPKRLWGADLQKNAEFESLVSPDAKEICNAVWKTNADQDLCYRVTVGIESVTETMASLLKVTAPKFTTPNPTVVEKTDPKHPEVQCRMDTLLQGSICTAKFNESLIPGKKVSTGVESIEAEQEAAQTSCMKTSGYTLGLRPACWFKARL